MIIVTGSLVARAETFDEVAAACIQHSQRSRAEPGCLAHNIHTDLENPLRLVFVEHWADEAALRTHFRVPESGAFVRELRAKCESVSPIGIYATTTIPM
ncbi:MAG: putative quinol monooxygenase [bacterium]